MSFGALDNAVVGSHTEREWLNLLAQWNWLCFYCGEPIKRGSSDPDHEATKDHMVPISRGGVDFIGNIAPTCLRCNLLKGNKTVEEFKAERAWVLAEKSTGNTRCGSRPSDAHRDSDVALLPTVEIAAMWKRVLATMPDKKFPDTHTDHWYSQRREMLRSQAAGLKRMQREEAGQLVLPIFGDGTARKLCETEAPALVFKGIDVRQA